ncbi:MAG TPA: LCP family protein [Rubrobacteraceae bacterium]|nr:LCP family protein [Rubrobacteraceae bacterium]
MAAVLAVLIGAGAQVGGAPLARSLGVDRASDLNPLVNLKATHASFDKNGGSLLGGDPINILVLGVDDKPNDGSGSTARRSDTIMLVRISPQSGMIKLLSVPRDLMVEVSPGVESKVNAAYSYGGVSQTVSALENYADIRIDRYAIVDFEGFEAVVDDIGGVTVDSKGGFPPNVHIKEGVQHLNGRRALLYARYRGTPGGDLDRIERQQQLVAALRSKALRWNGVRKLPSVAATIEDHVQTDMGVQEAITLGRVLLQHGREARMTATQLKGTPETLPDGEQVLRPDTQANQALLREFRYQAP